MKCSNSPTLTEQLAQETQRREGAEQKGGEGEKAPR